jgi:anthranilate synthase/phosphoribosyltransferase
VAEAAVRLGIRRGMVVHGLDGQDEISVCAPTRIVLFEGAEADQEGRYDEFVVKPEDFGLDTHNPEALVGGDADENAEVAMRLLSGDNGRGPGGVTGGITDPVLAALHDAVVLNTGAALHIYGIAETISDGVQLARRAFEEGRPMETLQRVIEITHRRGAA